MSILLTPSANLPICLRYTVDGMRLLILICAQNTDLYLLEQIRYTWNKLDISSQTSVIDMIESPGTDNVKNISFILGFQNLLLSGDFK